MKIKVYPIFFIATFSFIFFVLYKGLQNSSIYVPETSIKKDLPVFEAEIIGTNRKILSNELFKNEKFYIMNIWASWCVPCRNEHPFLMNLKNQKNIEIIGLNYKDDFDNAKNFLNELGSPYKLILLDKDGTIAIEWGAYGVPESFLIYNNKIIKRIVGPLNNDLIQEIKKLIQ